MVSCHGDSIQPTLAPIARPVNVLSAIKMSNIYLAHALTSMACVDITKFKTLHQVNACKLSTMVMKLLNEGAVSMTTDAIYVCEIQHKKQLSNKLRRKSSIKTQEQQQKIKRY